MQTKIEGSSEETKILKKAHDLSLEALNILRDRNTADLLSVKIEEDNSANIEVEIQHIEELEMAKAKIAEAIKVLKSAPSYAED